ncbi:MAG: HNH endonuclease [Solirubrobacterales bacterium]|nr:HNH endonuclease [Solirubrobacterales bacterium]OJU94425.1 MAG: hypothetical protein BGO23_03215 [Solirubrobacterales bacterium 67-14]
MEGETLPTLTGKPNEILEVAESYVLVGTEQKPEGSRVYYTYLQAEVDRLWSESGERNIVTTGRGGVVGAILQAMGYELLGRPRRVVVPANEVNGNDLYFEVPLEQDDLATALDLYGQEEDQSPESVERFGELLETFPFVRELADEPEIVDAVEGRILTRVHRTRERNRKLVEQKKETVLNREGRLKCEVCDFDFESTYGARGHGFIECHHTIPLSEVDEGSRTKLSDLALVCANCHRMIHAKSPWLTMDELTDLLESQLEVPE